MSAFELERLMKDLMRRVHLLEVTQPMGYSSVSAGRSRFAGNESILVEGSGKVEGWWIVTGTQRVTGRFEGSGTCDWTGPATFRGKFDVTGDALISGNFSVTGTMRIRKNATLEADLEILSGGKIKAGGMIIDTTGNGSVTFANGAKVASSGSSVSVMKGTSAATVDDNSAKITAAGSSVEVNGNGVRFSPTGIPQATGTGLTAGILLMDPSTGYLRRVHN